MTRLEDETLIECVADLGFLEADQWTVVDFKTDGELGALMSRGIAVRLLSIHAG